MQLEVGFQNLVNRGKHFGMSVHALENFPFTDHIKPPAGTRIEVPAGSVCSRFPDSLGSKRSVFFFHQGFVTAPNILQPCIIHQIFEEQKALLIEDLLFLFRKGVGMNIQADERSLHVVGCAIFHFNPPLVKKANAL